MANLSFTSLGATPFNFPSVGKTQTSTASGPSPIINPSYQNKGFPAAATALNNAQNSPAPSTPVKKQTTNNVDGSSTVTEYHAPTPVPVAPEVAQRTGTGSHPQGQASQSDSGVQGTRINTPSQNNNAATFPGILGSLTNTSQNGSATTPGYISKTADYGAGNIPIGESAAQIAADYGKKIADVGQLGAKFEGGLNTTGTSPVAQGNAAIAAQTTAAQQNALASGESAALQGTAQQLTAQDQAASAANNAAGQSNTAQGLVQSGLTSAGGLAQPQLGSIGQVPFNPSEGTQGAVLGSTQPGGVSAAGNLLGQLQGAQAAGAAPGQAQASNIQTAGTYQTNTAATGGAAATQGYNTLNAANNQFEGQASQLLSTLSQYQLNGTLPDINKPLNSISGRLGSTGVSALNAAFAETVAAYNNILSSNGGTPTAQDEQSLQALNINSTPAQIATSIQQLQAAAKIKLDAARGLAQGYNSAIGGSSSQPSQGGVIQTSAGAINPNF